MWIESKKAAKQFGIPIVIVEREKCAEKESKEIEKMTKDGKQKSDITIALDALNRLQTNIAGNRDYHIDIAMKYFSSSKTEEILELIKSILLQEIHDKNYEKFKEDFMQVTEFEKKEKRKWEITGIVLTTEFEGYDHEKFLRELSDIYSMYLKAIKENKQNANELDVLRILNSNDESLKSIKYSEKILECIQTNTQLTCDEVVQIITKYNLENQINEIKNTSIYDESRAHSIHHIQDVIIFGTVLGHNLGLDEKDMKILIEACKYHIKIGTNARVSRSFKNYK